MRLDDELGMGVGNSGKTEAELLWLGEIDPLGDVDIVWLWV